MTWVLFYVALFALWRSAEARCFRRWDAERVWLAVARLAGALIVFTVVIHIIT